MTLPRAARGPSRHELPAIDDAALRAARLADPVLAYCRERGLERWERVLGPIPDALRDGALPDVRAAARTARSTFGTKDSLADAVPSDLWIPLRDAVDDLIRRLARLDADRHR
jgi:hypothetical protein